MTEQSIKPNQDDDIKYERMMYERLDAMLEDNVDTLSYMWRFGDGEGGYILSEIKSLLVSNGDIKQPIDTKLYTKKTINQKLRWSIFKRDSYKCVVCSSDSDLTVDHIIPEKRGGKGTCDNLQTLCRSCNSIKGVSEI